VFRGSIPYKTVNGKNAWDWLFAASGVPEKLYGFHKGRDNCENWLFVRVRQGYICRNVSKYCALCGTAPAVIRKNRTISMAGIRQAKDPPDTGQILS
jgi:hypothetical protein